MELSCALKKACYLCKNIVKNDLLILEAKGKMDFSETDLKSEKNYLLYCHLAIFGVILAMFLESQSYDFDAIAHAGASLGVE